MAVSSGKPRVIAVMPAYNAETTLRRTIDDIPKGSVDHIILVDDCSRDATVAIARDLGLHVISHERNLGYGGNQKTCYRAALEAGAEIVVMIHPDYQYDSRLIPYMTGLIRDDVCDVILGNRIRTRREALDGGMPLTRIVGGWRGSGQRPAEDGLLRAIQREVVQHSASTAWSGRPSRARPPVGLEIVSSFWQP